MKFRSLMAMGLMASSVACGSGASTGGLDADRVYSIALTSGAEVPAPKPTTASGAALILVYPDRIEFQLQASNITAITMAHIHSGAPGVAGPIVVTLFQPASPTGAINGLFASGSLSAGSLPQGVTVASLTSLLASGNAYVNVHTSANPLGEIRGQVQ